MVNLGSHFTQWAELGLKNEFILNLNILVQR